MNTWSIISSSLQIICTSIFDAAANLVVGEEEMVPPPAANTVRKLIVGLGNHGMLRTRHSVGMQAVNELAKTLELEWNYRRDCLGYVTNPIPYKELELVILRPKLLMNINGNSVAKAFRAFKIQSPKDVILVHDDLDRGLGKVRDKHGGSAGGHNGVRSTTEKLKSENTKRVRVGIGRPMSRDQVTHYVLSDFTPEEKVQLAEVVLPDVVQRILALAATEGK
eukprot:m.53817 g.53817  ORF g.53817 m.53817 type:complete len:222 (+) comp10883_c0_seq8:1782-2447(+)